MRAIPPPCRLCFKIIPGQLLKLTSILGIMIASDLWCQFATSSEDPLWLLDQNRSYRRGEALAMAHALADALPAKAGEHIGLCLRDPRATMLLFLACWLRGAVAVPINPAFPTSQKAKLVQQTACVRCLDDRFFADFRSAVRLQNPHRALAAYPGFDVDTWAGIIFTSGSSGTPKAVILSLGNLFYNAYGANKVIPLSVSDRWLLSLPLFHVGGLGIMLRTLLAGAGVVLPHTDLASALHTQRLTHLSLVPTQLHRLLRQSNNIEKLQQLKAILLGGAAIGPSLLRQIKAYTLPVYASYGCSEMASQVVSVPLFRPVTAATALPYREWRLSPNGEIEVRGRTRFVGYWKDGEVQLPFDKEGWFATGDLGWWQDGQLAVSGRKDAMFISGGENIHPQTIEALLLKHPRVERVSVVAVRDAEFGMRPVVFVDSPIQQPVEWDAALRRQLAGFQVPDLFLPWPEQYADTLKPARQTLTTLAQLYFDRWVCWRFFRNWLRQHPPGWKYPLVIDDKQVFQLIDHQNTAQPRQILVCAQSREQVMDWLLDGFGQRLLTVEGSATAWCAIKEPIQRSVRERVEVIRLLAEDPHPCHTRIFDATVSDSLRQYSLSLPPAPLPVRHYLNVMQNEEPNAPAICLGAEAMLPENNHNAPILQFGVYLPATQRSYILRCFYNDGRCPDGLLGWKVQALREADGVEREQPFWDLTVAEELMLEAVMLQWELLPRPIPPHTNFPRYERRRRALWQQKLALLP